jgi:hypothetical protein
MQKPIIEGRFLIQKMNMKGGWSYVILPALNTKTGLPFGWNIVCGNIDEYKIDQYKLWPTSEGKLFLPIKSEIRKKIKKEEGDYVNIKLFEDKSEVIIPEEFILCLEDCPAAKFHFDNMSETSKKQYVDFIYSAKSLETQAKRMAKSIEKIEKGLKYHEKE